MKLPIFVTSLMTLTILSGNFLISPLHAQTSCDSIPEVPAAREMREIHSDKFRFSFKIPRNYRAIADGNGETKYILILSPKLYEAVECLKRNNIRTEGFFQTILVTIAPNRGRYQNITDFLTGQGDPINIAKTIKVAGESAVLGVANVGDLFATAKVIFLTSDKKFVISIEALHNSNDGELPESYNPNLVPAITEFQGVIDTFKFGN